MSDLPDSPLMTRHWCPRCEPDRDPSRELLHTYWCPLHTPSATGADDYAVTFDRPMFATESAEGENNRAFCEVIHRAARG